MIGRRVQGQIGAAAVALLLVSLCLISCGPSEAAARRTAPQIRTRALQADAVWGALNECGTQWIKSVSCGADPTKKDVATTCCPDHTCDGEGCVEVKADKKKETQEMEGTEEMEEMAKTEEAAILTEPPATDGQTAPPTASPTALPQTTGTLSSTGLIDVPLTNVTVTLTFPRSQLSTLTKLRSGLVADVTESFLYSRLLGELDKELEDGLDMTGVSLRAIDVEFENMDQVPEELEEAGLANIFVEKEFNGGGGGRRTRNRRQLQQDPKEQAFTVGRPKAVVTLKGTVKFRVDSDLLEPAPCKNNDEACLEAVKEWKKNDKNNKNKDKDRQNMEGMEFVLEDPDILPSAEELHGLSEEIWSDDKKMEDYLDLLRVAGDNSRNVLAKVNFVKVVQDEFVLVVEEEIEEVEDVVVEDPFAEENEEEVLIPEPTDIETEQIDETEALAPIDGEVGFVGGDTASSFDEDEDKDLEDDASGGLNPISEEDLILLLPDDSASDPESSGSGGGNSADEWDPTTTFIPVDSELSASASAAQDGGGGDMSNETLYVIIGVMCGLVVLLGLGAVFLVQRKKRLDKSAGMVDRARMEHDLDGDDSILPAGEGGEGGWSSRFKPKVLSPGKADKNKAVGLPTDDDLSSVGDSSLGDGSIKSKDSWYARVRSNVSLGTRDIENDDFSVGGYSIGGRAAAPAFTGDDVVSALGPMDPERGELEVEKELDLSGGYDMSRTETGMSAWSFSRIGGKKDPPAPHSSRAVPQTRPDVGVEVTTEGPQNAEDDITEFAPNTDILDEEDKELEVPGGDAFNREFNRNISDLSHISRGPGFIAPRGSAGNRFKSSLATHIEGSHNPTPSSPPPPPPAESPPKESPSSSPSIRMMARSMIRKTESAEGDSTPSTKNKSLSYGGLARARTASPTSFGVKKSFSGEKKSVFRSSFGKRGSFDKGTEASASTTPTASTTSTTPTASASSAGSGVSPEMEIQRKRMEARRKMQMQMEYDATPLKSPRYALNQGNQMNLSEPTTGRQTGGHRGVSSYGRDPTDPGNVVLNDLDILSNYLKEKSQQKSHPNVPEKPPKATVASYMRDREYY